MTHPTPATSSTTRKLSPAMQAVVDAMRDGKSLSCQVVGQFARRREMWALGYNPILKVTAMALLGRGLIQRMTDSHDPRPIDRYILTPAGLAAATPPPAAVTSDLTFPYADTLEEEVPLGPELDIDSIADYEAAQVSEAMRLITIRETNWYSDKVVRNQAIKALALIDGHWIMDAEAALKAQAVTDQTREVA